MTLVSCTSVFFMHPMGKLHFLVWFGTPMTSFAQGWSGFRNLFSSACHWWCDFSSFKLKPRQLIIKCDSLWVFAVFLFLLHVECQEPCCIQLFAIHNSPCNWFFPYHLANFYPFQTRNVRPVTCQDSSCKLWPGMWQALHGWRSTWPHMRSLTLLQGWH